MFVAFFLNSVLTVSLNFSTSSGIIISPFKIFSLTILFVSFVIKASVTYCNSSSDNSERNLAPCVILFEFRGYNHLGKFLLCAWQWFSCNRAVHEIHVTSSCSLNGVPAVGGCPIIESLAAPICWA